ncbi:hypothetical protein T02_4611 [Trichinella nativa]|uniref:Uncharacterized protein n=1 Tax=Trichinella nativa TaxID=6335 RepID=A0A0V1KSW6_9BILA|nr:hypothetical protein T02_15868 [Trichinella nativa]KRZ50400.1 hypothetical protein T02_4611 [Trichinella nativa]
MDLFKTFNVKLYVNENSALNFLHLHFGYAPPPFVEQHCNNVYFNDVFDFFLLYLFATNDTSHDFRPCFTFPRQPNKKVNLINRYNFPVASTNALSTSSLFLTYLSKTLPILP